MKKLFKRFIAIAAMVVLVAAISGCPKQEGPAERTGKQVDETIEKSGEQLEQAGENVQGTAEGKQ